MKTEKIQANFSDLIANINVQVKKKQNNNKQYDHKYIHFLENDIQELEEKINNAEKHITGFEKTKETMKMLIDDFEEKSSNINYKIDDLIESRSWISNILLAISIIVICTCLILGLTAISPLVFSAFELFALMFGFISSAETLIIKAPIVLIVSTVMFIISYFCLMSNNKNNKIKRCFGFFCDFLENKIDFFTRENLKKKNIEILPMKYFLYKQNKRNEIFNVFLANELQQESYQISNASYGVEKLSQKFDIQNIEKQFEEYISSINSIDYYKNKLDELLKEKISLQK